VGVLICSGDDNDLFTPDLDDDNVKEFGESLDSGNAKITTFPIPV